ncbi:MAG: metallophosphoesterase [Bacteroidia bacterium]
MFLRFFIILLVIVLVELYFYQAVHTIIKDYSNGKKTLVNYLYLATSALTIGVALVSVFYPPTEWNRFFRNYVAGVAFILLFVKVLGATFVLVDDLVRIFRVAWMYVFPPENPVQIRNGISRLKFLSYISVSLAAIPFVSLVYGMFRGAFRYKVHEVVLKSPKIPASFHGLKIVQVSDIHTGSFTDNSHLEKAFSIVMDQKPDIIFFTGDLVNNRTDETVGFTETYKKLKAPMGVYSVFGNHDYGDYVQWESPEAKKANLEALKKVHADAGWKLMMNEHVALERNGEKIALLGIENWGGNLHFPKYGKMKEAHAGTEQYPFKILLSHDPSHWAKQVRPEYKDVDLTLSGHTHGMQFGIEIPGFKWSPVKYLYPQWAGLYKEEDQYLYVNRGLGFLGYPGRVGIWPEITVIELQRG